MTIKNFLSVLICAVMLAGFTACEKENVEENSNKNQTENLMHNGHEYVDLGLPSGLLWATCNVGAENPQDFGDYFAWGEIEIKVDFNDDNYKWGVEDTNDTINYGMTKYSKIDGDSTLILADDAANANWGGDWRMPTTEEQQELCDMCIWTWTTIDGRVGCEVKGLNGNTIFLPAAGYIVGKKFYASMIDAEGPAGGYWSSSLYLNHLLYAYLLGCASEWQGWCSMPRYLGLPIRAVFKKK